MNDDPSLPARPAASSPPHDDTVLDWARATGAADLLVEGLNSYLRRRRRRRLVLASAACAALLVGGATWIRFREPATAPALRIVASASILRPPQQTLPDGSTIDLNAGAEIEVRFGDSFRRIVLRKGEAHFQVARDPQRPFIVSAGGIEVRAVGTAFAVVLGSGEVDVLVTEGRVAVDTAASDAASANADTTRATSPASLVALEAGRRMVVAREAAARPVAPRVSKLSAADIQARLAWRVPRLKFTAAPLAQVVAMFNEHAVAGRNPRLVLVPGIPADLRVSGVLRSDDVDSLLKLLAGEFGISAEARTGEIVLRRR